MTKNETTEKLLAELKERLTQIYGSRIKSIILFGSYARGEEEEGSDIDILLVLDDFQQTEAEHELLIAAQSELCLKYVILPSVITISEKEFLTRQSPFLLNVRKEGVHIKK